jgi:hypothetical protein
MKFFLSLIVLFSLNASANHACFSVFDRFDDQAINSFFETAELQGAIRETSAGLKVIELTDGLKRSLSENPSYLKMKENTVEIIYENIEPFGHINVRIGTEIYSFNYIESTSQYAFDVTRISSGKIGYLFRSDKKVIDKMKDKIQKFYRNSQRHNVPPFDAYSGQLEIVKEGNKLRYKSTAPAHGNNNTISNEVKLVDDTSGAYLMTPDGEKYSLLKSGDKYYTNSYSCSSATTCVMDQFLGMPIDKELGKGGARYLQRYLENKLEIGFNNLEGVIMY